MNGMWISLKEKCRCGTKVTDVVHHFPRPIKRRSCSFEERSQDKHIHGVENQIQEQERLMRHINTRNWFHELETGDPSRNIIEMIFSRAAASTNTPRRYKKIEQILRVNNSIEALERFEKYREFVKKKACERYKMHPRSRVDGNELLQFYSTTKSCCLRKPYKLCTDVACQVCGIIHSGFNKKKNGIQLTTSIEGSRNDDAYIGKRAVVVCRVIAGIVVNRVYGENDEDGYDSTRTGMYSKSEYLIVKNPSAILPCFVIIFY